MKKLGNLATLTLLSLMTLTAGIIVAAPRQADALSGGDFDPASIISDTVFFNGDTMDANQIQDFLNAKVPVCDTYHAASGSNNPPFTCLKDYQQSIPATAGDSYCSGMGSNGASYSAAQIIYVVAKSCGINPQVLLVLLQKEQSLVTDTWPFASQYRSATGYGCPDTAACDSRYYGFFNQVYNAARQFNRYTQIPQSYTYAVGRTSFVAYQANRPDCGGTTITIQNKATAALYNYTPYQPNQPALNNLYGSGDGCSAYGNRNFWRMFNDWFGSTHGDLVRTPGDATVYLLSDNVKYPIASSAVLNDYSRLGPLRYVSDQFVGTKVTKQLLGRMIQGPDGTLYFVNSGIKLPFSSCTGDVVDYGYTCEQDRFAPLTLAQTNKLYSGPGVTKLVRSNSDGTVYYMDKGVKRPIPGWGELLSLNIPLAINVFNDTLVSQLPTGPQINGVGTLIKNVSSATVYVVSDFNTIYPVSSFGYMSEMGLNTAVRTISDTDLTTYQASSSVLNAKFSCNGTNYIATNGTAYSLTSDEMVIYGFDNANFVPGNKLCNLVRMGSKTIGRYIRGTDGTIYYINSNHQKQAFTSFNTYTSHQASNNASGYVQISGFFERQIASGPNL